MLNKRYPCLITKYTGQDTVLKIQRDNIHQPLSFFIVKFQSNLSLHNPLICFCFSLPYNVNPYHTPPYSLSCPFLISDSLFAVNHTSRSIGTARIPRNPSFAVL